jgi:hypothetical protein
MLSYDRPWWAGISFAFSILEVNTCLICGCVVTFSPLLSARPRKPSKSSEWTFDMSPTSRRKSSAVDQLEKSLEGQGHDDVPPPQLGYNAAPEHGVARRNSVLLSLGTDVPRFTADAAGGNGGSEDTLVRHQSYESIDHQHTAYRNGAYPSSAVAGSYYEQTPYSAGQPTVPPPVAFSQYQHQYQQAAPDVSWQYDAQSYQQQPQHQQQQQAYNPDLISPTQVVPAADAHTYAQHGAPQTGTPIYNYVYTPGQPSAAATYQQDPSEQYQYQYQYQYQDPMSGAPVSAISPATMPHTAPYHQDVSAYGSAPNGSHQLTAVPEHRTGVDSAAQKATPSSTAARDTATYPTTTVQSSAVPVDTHERGDIFDRSVPQAVPAGPATQAIATDRNEAEVYEIAHGVDRSLSNSTEPYSGVSSNFTNFADDDAPFDLGGLQALSEAQRKQRA